MTEIPQAHPTVTIDLTKYGYEGEIVMSDPTVMRMTACQTSITSFLNDSQIEEMDRIKNPREREAYIRNLMVRKQPFITMLTVLACVQKAPFHLNDYMIDGELDVKSFTEYIDDKYPVYQRMLEAVNELKVKDPLSV